MLNSSGIETRVRRISYTPGLSVSQFKLNVMISGCGSARKLIVENLQLGDD